MATQTKYRAEEEQDEWYVNAPSECEREGVEEVGNGSLFKGRPVDGMGAAEVG